MADVVLANPYFFQDSPRRKLWLFPPLGLGYLAASIERAGISVTIVDGTFLGLEGLIDKVRLEKPKVVGVTCNVVTKKNSLEIARRLKGNTLLVAGGPYPTLEPGLFLDDFDIVVMGEGEQTFLELIKARLGGGPIDGIDGIALKNGGKIVSTASRTLIPDLGEACFPARHLFDNRRYQEYWQRKFGNKTTPIMTTRGCRYDCKFCSKPIFGNTYRARNPEWVVKEMEEILALGYDRVWFADDLFTYDAGRVKELCGLIRERGLSVGWDCLCRTDLSDPDLLPLMRKAGCRRVFFGIESGSDRMLSLMGKRTTVAKARHAVELAKEAGLETGGFFMVGFPGETTESLIETIRFSASLPFDYISYTIAYPIPGTDFFEQVKGGLHGGEWDFEGENRLRFDSDISEAKLRLAILRGNVQFKSRKTFGRLGRIMAIPFELATDAILRVMR